MATQQTFNPEKLDFSAIVQELEHIVGQLETNNLSLEAAMNVFEQGMKLASEGKKRLAVAEKRVSILLKEQDKEILVPFEDAGLEQPATLPPTASE